MEKIDLIETNETKPLVVGTARARAMLDCSVDELYRLLKNGSLTSYLEGTRRKIPVSSIEAYIQKRLAERGGAFQYSARKAPKRQKSDPKEEAAGASR